MARTTATILILSMALAATACGRRGDLEAPPGSVPGAPDVTTRQPRQKPIEVDPPKPEEKPGKVTQTPPETPAQ